MGHLPVVSVITPSYNSAAFIADTIESVIGQSCSDWEMIIVDDCSSDDSVRILKEYALKESRIRLLELPRNQGPVKARNLAIEEARGRFIAFLDSDDVWERHKLEKQLAFMMDKEIALSYTAYYKMNEEGSVTGTIPVPERVSYYDLLKTCSIGCLTAMYDTSRLGKVYMPPIQKRQDYALWLQILKRVKHAYGLQECLARYRLRSASVSGNKIKAAKFQWKVYREIERLSFLRSCYYFSHYMFHGTIKTYWY